MRVRLLTTIGVLLVATALSAQVVPGEQPPSIVHSKIPCFLADQKPLLTATVNTPGTPRVYFREWGSSEWCYVDGTRTRNDAFVVLPEFPAGMSVEYFFVTWVKGRITGRSPVAYRVAVTSTCEIAPARHLAILALECEGTGAIPVAISGDFTTQDVVVSPSNPEQQ